MISVEDKYSSVYWQCVDALAKLWAPFLCYTMEEVWMHFNNDEAESIHYTEFPTVKEYSDARRLNKEVHNTIRN